MRLVHCKMLIQTVWRVFLLFGFMTSIIVILNLTCHVNYIQRKAFEYSQHELILLKINITLNYNV